MPGLEKKYIKKIAHVSQGFHESPDKYHGYTDTKKWNNNQTDLYIS